MNLKVNLKWKLFIGGLGLLVLNVVLWAVCYQLLKSGWKIKN